MIAGIDYSTKFVDVVLLDEEPDEDGDVGDWHRFPLADADNAFDRTRSVREAMPSRGWWEDNGVVAVGIEDPRGRYGTNFMYRVQGGILQCLPRDLLVQPWQPKEWRSRVGLPGNASKQAVSDWAFLLLGLGAHCAEWPQDAYDAYCIARATRDALEREQAA